MISLVLMQDFRIFWIKITGESHEEKTINFIQINALVIGCGHHGTDLTGL